MSNQSTDQQDMNNQTTDDVTLNEQTSEQAEQQMEAELEAAVENISQEQQKINELELTLAAVKATVTDQKDAVIRAKAEVDNIRRRSAQEVEKARKFALEKFASELLPVVDNLERAIASVNVEDETQKAIAEGVELTLQSMVAALTKFGVQAIEPQDQPFNPELHQAMAMQEVPNVEPNTVIAVMQKGYELNGRLVRPAMVMVSKAAEIDTNA
jgi:molecular chaperone GrpE